MSFSCVWQLDDEKKYKDHYTDVSNIMFSSTNVFDLYRFWIYDKLLINSHVHFVYICVRLCAQMWIVLYILMIIVTAGQILKSELKRFSCHTKTDDAPSVFK